MVDAAVILRTDPRAGIATTTSVATSAAPAIEVGVFDAGAYRRACSGLTMAPPQTPGWVDAFAAHTPDVLTVTLGSGAGVDLAIVLEVARQGPFTIAQFLGDRHANGNFCAIARGSQLTPATLVKLFAAIREIRPDIDALVLERQAHRLDGVANPLLSHAHSPSPNIALAVDLAGGFEGVLSRVSGKRKKKKHRSQARKFEAAGGFRHFRATTPTEVDCVLGAFFAMKGIRFQKMGIDDVFADASVRASFKALFTDALADAKPRFVLDALEVGGTLRAITGCSLAENRIVCEFGAIAEDDLAHTSPGEFLFFENIRAACAEGLAVYDFSVGDEQYKRLWCDIEEEQFDVFVPLSAKGHILVAAKRGGASLKRAIKGNPLLWSLIKRLRRSSAQPAAAPADED